MRKSKKEEINSLLKTLTEAVDSLSRGKGSVPDISLLCEMQETAIELGEYLERYEKGSEEIVHKLEAFCEGIGLCAAETDLNRIAKNMSELKGVIRETAEMISLLPTNLLYYFLPYKASMWDSMESVWLAAQKDDLCEAVVMPIPYFTRDDKGNVGEVIYEGTEFPSYVSVSEFYDTNLEELHPDAIFIHNPYDEHNHVTSVHPDYYSHKLKDYTDNLIYIPYFVTSGKLAEHFCVLPGTINSHKVIVQSEEVRKQYVSALSSFYERKGFAGDKAERQVLALGSPKLEKAICACEADYEIPNEWRSLIYRQNGSRKKVIFFNISISSLLSETEEIFTKLEETISLCERLEDIVLWWRPHPLYRSTLTAMKKGYLERYEEIVTAFTEKKIGIFDESADLYRAIVYSDAYLGDTSSVTLLFAAQKKPVMIQRSQANFVSMDNLFYKDNVLWFTDFSSNNLMKADSDFGEIRYAAVFPERNEAVRLFSGICECFGKLLFIPFAAENISIFDIEKDELISVSVPETENKTRKVKYDKNAKFGCALQEGYYVYLFPYTYPDVIRVNVETYEIEVLSDIMERVDSEATEGEYCYFVSAFNEDGYGLMWNVASNSLLRFDFEKRIFTELKKISKNFLYREIVAAGDAYWLIPRGYNGYVTILNSSFEYEDKIDISQYIFGNIPFREAVTVDEKVFLFPKTAQRAISINVKDRSVEYESDWDIPQNCRYEGKDSDWKYFCAGEIDGNLYGFSNFEHCFIEKRGKEVRKIRISNILPHGCSRAGYSEIERVLKTAETEGDAYLLENRDMSKEDYLSAIDDDTFIEIINKAYEEVWARSEMSLSIGAGQRIYDYIKGE